MSKVNISEIETFLNSILRGKVSDNVFVSTFPSTIHKKWDDMCLVDLSDIADMSAYGQGIVLLYLYARPLSNGTKNVSVMKKLENKLDKTLKDYPCERYFLSRRNTYSDFDSNIKWHFNVVEINITIV